MVLSVGTVLANVWQTVWPIVVALLLFCLVIVIHECGHFLFAKLFGIRVNEFSVGFGPALFKKKKGDTLYALRLVPFGGYCAMEGEDEESGDPRSFGAQKVWKRFTVVVAGALFNLLLGLALTAVMLGMRGQFYSTQIYGFAKNASSYSCGLRAGDVITSVDGRRVYTASDLAYMMLLSKDSALRMEVERDGKTVSLDTVSFGTQEYDGKTYIKPDFAVVPQTMTWRHPLTFASATAKETLSTARTVWMSLKDLIGGRFELNDMMGPVGLVSTVSESVSDAVSSSVPNVDISDVIYLMALITINLGIMNLLPLPALDGGRLLFLLAEGIFRKPVPAKYEGYVHTAGFVLLMLLIVIITGNDILRLIRG